MMRPRRKRARPWQFAPWTESVLRSTFGLTCFVVSLAVQPLAAEVARNVENEANINAGIAAAVPRFRIDAKGLPPTAPSKPTAPSRWTPTAAGPSIQGGAETPRETASPTIRSTGTASVAPASSSRWNGVHGPVVSKIAESSERVAGIPLTPEPELDPSDRRLSAARTSDTSEWGIGHETDPGSPLQRDAENRSPREMTEATAQLAEQADTPTISIKPQVVPPQPPSKVERVSSTQEVGTSNTRTIRPWIPSNGPFKDPTLLPPVTPDQLAALRLPREIDVRTRNMIKQGTSLAKRGATYSARQEFLAILQLVAQSYDSQLGMKYHTKALANGLRALEEADDFVARDVEAAVDYNLQAFIAGHKTPVLKNEPTDELMPYVAMQRYYDYACQQLSIAGRGSSAASAAMFAIGRTETMLAGTSQGRGVGGPKPLAYYHAALSVDPRNNPAANELGVMLARAGKVNEAHTVLASAAMVRPTPALLNNLAQTKRMLQGVPITPRPPLSPNQVTPEMLARRVQVKWVNPNEYSKGGTGPGRQPWPAGTNVAGRPAAGPNYPVTFRR